MATLIAEVWEMCGTWVSGERGEAQPNVHGFGALIREQGDGDPDSKSVGKVSEGGG